MDTAEDATPCTHRDRCVHELVSSAARRFGDRTAIVDDTRRMSFARIDEAVTQRAAQLSEWGLRGGERVVLYGDNSIDWIVDYYAILQARLVVVPVNHLLTSSEVAFIAAHSGARLIVGSASAIGTLRASGVVVPATAAWHEALPLAGTDERPPSPEVSDASARAVDARERLAAICYTSGTTGRPKGAALGHRGILHNVIATATMHGKSPNDVVLTALPLAHVYGNVVMQSAFACGATLVLERRFDAVRALERMAQERVTVFEGVPTMYYYLLAEVPERHDLASLRMLTVGGQSMPVARMREVERRLGAPLVELWGMTELSGLGATSSHVAAAAGMAPLGTIGESLPGVELRIRDGGTRVADGAVGELEVRGPIVMLGYWNDAAATAEVLDADGWLATGDVAVRERHGAYRIVDRKKDMILSAGYNIYPAEVEAAVSEHPAVAMVAVVGIPDEAKGEIPVAHVVLRADAQLNVESLLEHCRARLAAYKVPRRVVFVPDLPKTSSGKLRRRDLREASTPPLAVSNGSSPDDEAQPR